MDNNNTSVLELTLGENSFEFTQSISSALERAELELSEIENEIAESESTLKALTPQCDRIDYILAASGGALCGLLDIFFVGKPGESLLGDITDKWFENRTKDFAKMCKWDSSKDDSLRSAICHLEKKFKIPYDQRGAGDAASFVFDLNPGNHHFKSLGHNPTIEQRLDDGYCTPEQLKKDNHMIIEGFKAAGEQITLIEDNYEASVEDLLDGMNREMRSDSDMKLSVIFEEKPKRWGFRGDPFFWDHLRGLAGDMDIISADELEEWIKNEYFALSGKPLTDEYMDFAVISQFAHGGMSSGGVDNQWWMEEGIPLLKSRLRELSEML